MDEQLDGKTTVRQMTIRVPISTYLLLDGLARAARIPVAVAARNLLIDKAVKASPPLISELTETMRHLILVCNSSRSCLTQLHAHAGRLGGPLNELTGSTGPLAEMAKQLLKIGIKVKSGHTNDDQAAAKLTSLASGAEQINALARRLNSSESVAPADWRPALESLSKALQNIGIGSGL